MNRKFLLLLLLLFLVIGGIGHLLHLANAKFLLSVLWIGNAAIALITLISYFVAAAKIQARPMAFVGGVTGASLLKMVVIIGLVLVYVVGLKQYYHKSTLFVLLGVYLLYTGMEAIFLSRLAKRKV